MSTAVDGTMCEREMAGVLRSCFGVSIVVLSVCVSFLLWTYENHIGINQVSSVWCVDSASGTRICQFHNVCYNMSIKSFYFYLDTNSVISGLANYQQLQKIQLSSVHNHNNFFANFTIYNEKTPLLNPNLFVLKAVALVRFKPDNVMHVIHDDLLPLFFTLEKICKNNWNCFKSFQLVLLDGHSEGPYSNLYQKFSVKPVIFTGNYQETLICFNELHLGLDVESLWYKYGFNEPRAPLKLENYNFDALKRFREFITKGIAVSGPKHHALLIERPNTRRILNTNFLFHSLKEQYRGEIVHINATKHNFLNMLELITNTDILMGVHGAEMILAIFMKPGGKIIELFPFGIQPEKISFLRPLSLLKYCPYTYFAWENIIKNNTIRHPEYPPELGGISHLPLRERQSISNIKRVHKVNCCQDPAFLHLMFQDTIVGPEIKYVIHDALSAPSPPYSSHLNWLYPSHVLFLSCILTEEGATISWQSPDNIDKEDVQFSVTVSFAGKTMALMTSDTNLLLRGVTGPTYVWISAIFNFNNNLSPDAFVQCSPPNT